MEKGKKGTKKRNDDGITDDSGWLHETDTTVKTTSAKDPNASTKNTSAKDPNASMKNTSAKDPNASMKNTSAKDPNASTKNASAKDPNASTKNTSAKVAKSKDEHAKDASAHEAKSKADKSKDTSAKGSKGKPPPSDTTIKNQAESEAAENTFPTEAEAGSDYEEFSSIPVREKLPGLTPMKKRRVYYHDENDLADTLDETSPKGTVAADDMYSPWDEAVKSMRQSSVISGLSMAFALVADVAVNGTEKLSVERVWLPVQFLRTVMNDKGETPPNILKFLEHIDVQTKDTGKANLREVYTYS